MGENHVLILPMTPEALKKLRKDKGWTREQMGKELGCSAGAIVHWESGSREIPTWVEEKLIRNVEITLKLVDMKILLDYALATGVSLEGLLSQAMSSWLNSLPLTESQYLRERATLKESDIDTAGSPATEEELTPSLAGCKKP